MKPFSLLFLFAGSTLQTQKKMPFLSIQKIAVGYTHTVMDQITRTWVHSITDDRLPVFQATTGSPTDDISGQMAVHPESLAYTNIYNHQHTIS